MDNAGSDERKAALLGLTPGDEVAVYDTSGYERAGRYYLTKLVRRTAGGRIVVEAGRPGNSSETDWYYSDGSHPSINGSWAHRELMPVTPKIRRRIQRDAWHSEIHRRFKEISWSHQSDAFLDELAGLLRQSAGPTLTEIREAKREEEERQRQAKLHPPIHVTPGARHDPSL